MKQHKYFLSLLILGVLGIFLTNTFTGMQVVNLEEKSVNEDCPIFVEETKPCGYSKNLETIYGDPQKTLNQNQLCSKAQNELIAKCTKMSCAPSCKPNFVKTFERFSEQPNLCTMRGSCICNN